MSSRKRSPQAARKIKRYVVIHYVCLFGVIAFSAYAWSLKLWPDSAFSIFNSIAVVIAAVYLAIGIIYALLKEGATLKDLFFENYNRHVASKRARSITLSLFFVVFAAAGVTTALLTTKYSFKNRVSETGSLKINFTDGSFEKLEDIGKDIEKRYILTVQDVYFCCSPQIDEENKTIVHRRDKSCDYEITTCEE
jgi:hypothetical protein